MRDPIARVATWYLRRKHRNGARATIAQTGKIANVGASLLVGSVPRSLQSHVSGVTDPTRRAYIFNGIDSRHIVDELRRKDGGAEPT